MSVLEAGEADRSTMSPLDEVVSPTSVESELMVTDMLDEHETTLNEHRDGGKRKRDTDGEELTPRKLPSLTRNNNDVGFVLEESADDDLREDRDDVSRIFLFFLSLLSFLSCFRGGERKRKRERERSVGFEVNGDSSRRVD